MVSGQTQDYKEKWLLIKEASSDSAVESLVGELIEELERLAGENKRLKTALLKATTAQKPTMSTKLSEALRE
ncbi:hypothetical protein SAMN02799630_01451 [Paenibacillus sp. UNCCL117]|uniref:hypothetical protein n=1 Tax=unclassified Paenibacillus TaxID=185978 RepID=UPI00088D2048|nr:MULTISPECIES: hypothetical protein [unclassified Paenibacillus]SDC77524.1 hypothetical protein SAMN04488602_103430 [Paenibacillus sp. cl123]SFW25844.1 hypothetical protein SAMN02799630_01451 [Paenibacillus sp. UNCCL117]